MVRRRFRYRRFSEAEQAEIWRLVATGARHVDVALALDTTRQGVRALLGRTGGVRPRPRQRSPRHLSAPEREEISRALLSGSSLRGIAARLGRAPSTVVREVRRNGGRGAYRALHAERAALDRGQRPKAAKLVRDYPDEPAMRISHEAIYQSLFIQTRGALRRELTRYLRRPRTQRRTAQRLDDRGRLRDMINISQRPAEVADRAVPGHWEGDLLIGGGRQSAIGTLVERGTRFVLLVALPDGRSAPAVRDALTRCIQTLPAQLRRSLTWDQGRELAEHVRFTVDTGVQVYFCDPHSPWQRGSNENTNGLLRQYFPKGADLSRLSQVELDAVAAELNGRPRHTLGWMKPSEALAAVLR